RARLYVVDGARLAAGVNWIETRSPCNATDPVTEGVSCSVALPMEVESIGSFITARMSTFTGTLVAASAGVSELTVGALVSTLPPEVKYAKACAQQFPARSE